MRPQAHTDRMMWYSGAPQRCCFRSSNHGNTSCFQGMLGETGIPGNQGEKVTNVSFCHAKYRVKATYPDPRRICQRTFGICSAKDYRCTLELQKTRFSIYIGAN